MHRLSASFHRITLNNKDTISQHLPPIASLVLKVKALPHLVRLFLISATIVLLQGCSLTDKVKQYLPNHTPAFEAQNAYQTGTIENSIERVIILPIFHESKNGPVMRDLDTIFIGELNKTLLFEVVPVSREKLKMLFGQEHFSSVERLPLTLFDTLKEAYGAQAIVFTDITYYDPYRPIAIGLRSKLADLENGNVIWACDQVFDSGDPRIAQSAMHYFEQLNTNRYPLNRAESILQSPQRFSRFVAFATFQTLPKRPVRYLDPAPEEEIAEESLPAPPETVM